MQSRAKWVCGAMLLLLLSIMPVLATNVWQPTGGPQCGNINDIAIDPLTPETVYVGVNGGGVYKSQDGGSSWTAKNQGLPASNLYIEALAVSRSNAQVVYAGISSLSNSGVYKSTNGGNSWEAKNSNLSDSILSLAIDPANSEIVYAGSTAGVFKSIDGGNSWQPLGGLRYVYSVVLSLSDKSIIYAATSAGVFKSTNGGSTWLLVKGGYAYSMAVGEADSQTLYAGFFSNGVNVVSVSTDAGNTWQDSESSFASPVLSVAISATDSQTGYAGTNGKVFKTSDGGITWNMSGDLPMGVVNSLAINPNGAVYAGTWTGVFKSLTGGNSWSSSSRGIWAAAFTVTTNPFRSDTVFAGTHSGVFVSLDAGVTWIAANEGFYGNEGIYALEFDPQNSKIIYAGAVGNSGIYKSTNGGLTWTALSSPINYVRAMVIDHNDVQTIYAGSHGGGVAKSRDGGISWSQINTGLGSRYIWSMAMDPFNSNILYVGTYDSGVFKTTDGGNSWFPVNNGITNMRILDIDVDPNYPQNVYAGTSSGIFKSATFGAAWALCNNRGSSITFDPAKNYQTLFAAYAEGVSVSANGGATWTSFSDGLTSTNLRDIALDPLGGSLYIGSANQGVYKGLAKISQPTISGTPSTTATVGSNYAFTPSSTFAGKFGVKGVIPPGIVLNTATGALSGTPTLAGTYSGIVITVANDTGSSSLPAFSITVAPSGQGGATPPSVPLPYAWLVVPAAIAAAELLRRRRNG